MPKEKARKKSNNNVTMIHNHLGYFDFNPLTAMPVPVTGLAGYYQPPKPVGATWLVGLVYSSLSQEEYLQKAETLHT